MARKTFSTFVTDVAGRVDDMEHKIKSDPRVVSIFNGRGVYQDRVSAAVSYWRSRPDYVDVNRALTGGVGRKPGPR